MNGSTLMAPLALAQMAMIELWRNRLVALPLAAGLLLGLGLYFAPVQNAPNVANMREWELAIDLLPMVGQLLGVLAGGAMIAAEVERGTAAMLVTRQPRWVLVLGKALGAGAFVLSAFAFWAVIFLAISLAHGVPVQSLMPLTEATLLGCLPGLLMVCVAVAFSTRAATHVAIGGVAMLFMLKGMATTMLLGEMLNRAPITHALAKGLVYALPTDGLADIARLVAQGNPLPQADQLALLGIPAWLLLAVLLFARRDLSR